ncbi:MAG: CAP domain-containing protein [Phycisphaerae bacterium]|nr:CAP domain-containing protein [Phycisphaerae bacterium]
MKAGSSLTLTIQLALSMGSVFLAGCPSASDFGTGTQVAGLKTDSEALPEGGYTPSNADVLVARMLELVNNERTGRGLQPLTLNPILSQMADDYAKEMIECGFFSHLSPTGEGPGQRAVSAGYVFLAVGENLAGGQTTPEQAMADWMKSTEGHRENVLSPQWKEIGIAVRVGGEYGVYWVQEYGNPPTSVRISAN